MMRKVTKLMSHLRAWKISGILLALLLAGCAATPSALRHHVSAASTPLDSRDPAPVTQVAHQVTLPQPTPVANLRSLDELIEAALQANPRLRSAAQRIDAAWAMVPQVRSLPDPSIGVNVFGHAIETAAGSQQAILSLRQRVPSLKRLEAEEQRAALAASALEQSLRSEQLWIIAEVKSAYAELYLLGQQIRINEANQKILDSIIKVELARAGTAGRKTAVNDTTRASLEQTRLAEALVRLKQKRISAAAMLNELLNRSPEAPLPEPKAAELRLVPLSPWGRGVRGEGASEVGDKSQEALTPPPPPPRGEGGEGGSFAVLRAIAEQNQPELVAAGLRAEATRLGIEVADLQRIPDVTFSANWFFTDGNRPPSRVVNVGQDAWSIGAMVDVPIWHQKYDAIKIEARSRHAASLADVQTVRRRYDALLADLLERAKSAQETLRIYEKAILPQARETFRIDRNSLGAGNVEFDRVMTDLRNLITLEIELHRAKATLATVLARLEQAVGVPWNRINQFSLHEKDSSHESNNDKPQNEAP